MNSDASPPATELPDVALLRRELEEAHKTTRTLLRQLSKAEARHNETTRAYDKTVQNLLELSRENMLLTRERDQWKARAERQLTSLHLHDSFPVLTLAEVSAIRRAMARLHHPDRGGDSERMKLWNTLLDPLEQQRK